jgi:hypothetical protein
MPVIHAVLITGMNRTLLRNFFYNQIVVGVNT